MKRMLLLLTFMGSLVITQAQETDYSGPNYTSLEKKLSKSDEAINDAKSNIKPKTWISRGEVFQDIYDVNVQFLRKDMTEIEAKLYFKSPLETKIDDKGRTILVYERINLIFKDGKLTDWEETKSITKDPLPQAFNSFQKALELDVEHKSNKAVSKAYDRLKGQFHNLGIYEFGRENYAGAFKAFEYARKIDTSKVYAKGINDTVIIYYTGFAAFNAKMPNEAMKYCTLARELNYKEPNLYIMLSKLYEDKGDSTASFKVLSEGYEKYPENSGVLFEIINYYLKKGEASKAIDYLKLAKEKDPTNYSLYFAQGTMYEKLKDVEKAKESYLKAIEIKPDYFDAYYNLGALFFNVAAEIFKSTTNIPMNETERYNAEVVKANENLKIAIPYFEKASEINPNDFYVWQNLQTLYTRVQDYDKAKIAKAKVEELRPK
jgi:tetratricopeptide (TPR) repeat protein